MFIEVAEVIVTDPAGFEAAVAEAKPVFLRAKGCHGVRLHRVVEEPKTYRLIVKWETIEDHTVVFRNSADFQEWRRVASPFFAAPPKVTHSEDVLG